MKCPRCQQDNPSHALFCLKCGVPLDGRTPIANSYADLKREIEGLKGENEGLRRSLDDAVEREAATGEVLRVISQSPTDVQPVFDSIASSALRLCDGIASFVFRHDGTLIHLAAVDSVRGVDLQPLRHIFPAPPEQVTFVGRVVATARLLYIADIEHDREAPPGLIEFARANSFRSIFAAPMLRDGRTVGAIAVTHRNVDGFTPKQGTLLQTFADQAVIAIENVRLFTETKEALEQQTATAEILRVISSSPTDIQPVFDAVAESAARLCEAFDSSIWRRDGDSFELVAHHGPIRQDIRLPVIRGTAAGRAVLDGRTIHVNDMQTEGAEFPESRELAQRLGFRTLLCTPLIRKGVAIGVITLRRTEIKLFTDRQVALLQTFADQAVIAIENVRLFKELQEKNRALTQAHAQVSESLEHQTATAEVLKVISRSTFDLQPVLDTLIENAARLCGARRGVIFRRDGEAYHGVAFYNTSPDTVAFVRAHPITPGRHTITARVALERRTIHVADLQEDPEYRYVLRDSEPIRTELGVPMFRDDDILGVIILFKIEVEPFTDKQIELVETFADQAVIAIENVRLFRELETRNAELTETLARQTATGEVLRVISQTQTDAQPVFDVIARSARRLCGAAYSQVQLYDGESIHLATLESAHPEGDQAIRAVYPLRVGDGSAGGRAIATRAVVQIPDLLDDQAYAFRSAWEASGLRSLLAVPMLRDGEPIGTIGIGRTEPGAFPQTQIDLLRTFADQAVIAIENVRLFKELEARNRDLTATSEILRVIASSPTDLQPVFDTIAERSMRLCGTAFGWVMTFDGQLVHLRSFANVSPEGAEALRQVFPLPASRGFAAGRTILTGEGVEIPDVLVDPEYMGKDTAKMGKYRSILTVPLLHQGRSIGVIAVGRPEPGPFSREQIQLLQTFADQAVIAIENVRLFKELEARTADLTRSVEQLTALGEVGRAVSSTLDLETVLRTIVSRAVQLSGLDGGVVFEYDESAEEFVQRAMTDTGGPLAEARRTTRIRKGEGVLGRTAITLEPVQVADITSPGAYEGRLREILIDSGVRAILAVPMVREGHLIGCLGVTRNQPGEFPAETIELLRTFATQSALAIQNARLFREIEQKSRELEVASQHKSEFLANMSHELRTPLNAVIGFSEVLSERMFGELNEKQDEYLKDIHASGQHLLSLINDILDLSKIEAGRMELELSDFDLPMTIDNALMLVRERAARRGIDIHRSVDERLGYVQADERKIRQVLLNLLSNAIKFTQEGGRIEVGAKPVNGSIEVSVTDTGVGIAPEDQEAVFEEFKQVGTAEKKVEGTGLGLALSRKFIELHGGKISVKSRIGEGSTFTFTVPGRRGE